jgi:chromosome segregation ATPase
VTADPRVEIAAAVADAAPDAALRALHWALTWSARAVRELRTADDDVTMTAVIALDDALTGSADLLTEVPGLLDRARTGRPVEDYLHELGDRLTSVTRQVSDVRSGLDELRRQEQSLRDRLAEHDDLRRQVTELRRLARLATALDALREQRDLIDARVALLTEQVGDTEATFADGAVALVRLTEDQLTVIREPTRRALDDAAAAQAKLSAEEERATAARAALAEAVERQAKLRTERIERLAALEAHARADREIAEALGGDGGSGAGGLERVRDTLNQVQDRLREVDTALGRALEAAQRRLADEHPVLNWAD